MVVHKVKPFPLIKKSSPLFALSQSCAFILAANWLMQGMRGMDRGELLFRLGLGASLLVALTRLGLPWPFAFLIAHTVNFTINGQVWVCIRYCPFYSRDPLVLERWLEVWLRALTARPWLGEAVIIGSRARRLASQRSDIDLRLIAPSGPMGWLRANWLMLMMRNSAFWHRIPLDAYVYDRPESLLRFDQAEPLAILVDRHHRIAEQFAHRQRVSI